jgi:hypothetical protein
MKYLFGLTFALVLAAGCREKELTYEQVEKKLMKTMNDYLNKSREGKVEFTVKEVVFFPEKSRYLCEFRVNMKTGNLDTIGIMKANISKNFKDVERTY